MKKYRKQIYRITSLLCSIVLIVSLAALPAYAVSDQSESVINVLEYSLPNNSDSYHCFVKPGDNEVHFTLPATMKQAYVDVLVSIYGSVSSVQYMISTTSSTLTTLTMQQVSGSYYRLYGEINNAVWDDTCKLIFNVSSQVELYFYSFDLWIASSNAYREKGRLQSTFGDVTMSSGSSSASVSVTGTSDYVYPENFYCYAYCDNWKKYDYVDYFLSLNVNSISSISCYIGNETLPFEVSIFYSDGTDIIYRSYEYAESGVVSEWDINHSLENDFVDVIVRIDLTGVRKNLGYTPVVDIQGNYSKGQYNSITVNWYTGYISVKYSSTRFFIEEIKAFFADLFGKDEPAAEQAAQSQEQLNVEINNQVSAAVSDWDVHIVEVQDGYDSGFEGAVPALSWLSSLAEGIFGNMGWFGSIYLLVGLISVYVLFLNKGGLIGRKLK